MCTAALSNWNDNNQLSKLDTKYRRVGEMICENKKSESAKCKPNVGWGMHFIEWEVFRAYFGNTHTILKVT